MTRILIVDDHPVFRRGLSALLRASGFDVVGEAASGSEAVDLAAALRPDLVVMDLGLPDVGGMEATRRIVDARPEARVLVVTLYNDEHSVRAALAAGATGYLLKDSTAEQILGAVHAAVTGAHVLGQGVQAQDNAGWAGAWPESAASQEAAQFDGLTRRESSVAELIGKGLSNQVIAERLGLSSKTVANYVSIVVLKLGADDRREAARVIRERS